MHCDVLTIWSGRMNCVPVVGDLSRVAGQKQTLQGMARRTNFPRTIPFYCFINLGNLWNFNFNHLLIFSS